MPKKDKNQKQYLPKKLAAKVVEILATAGMTVPDCTAEELAVAMQEIIRDAAMATYQDEESIYGELLLLLDDCRNQAPPPPGMKLPPQSPPPG